jgi:quercetin dioxygenase-like cupin family protein
MKKSSVLDHRTGRTGRSAPLFLLVGVALVCGAGIVAIRCRTRMDPEEIEAEGRQGSSTVALRGDAAKKSLVGHEFRFRISGHGHRLRILESTRQTDGESLRGEYFAAPRAFTPVHAHRRQQERFETVSGTLSVRVGGRELLLRPGQSAVGPPGVPHEWWNPSDEEEAHFLYELRPGLRVETTLETIVGLARDGKTVGMVPKNPLQLAVLAHEVGSWMVLKPAQKALFAPVASLAFAGRLLGYRASYPEYSGSRRPRDRTDSATTGNPAAYSPECVEGEFSEVRFQEPA